MTNYEKPMVLDNMDAVEGVYAYSGRDDGEWNVEVWWRGHNTGSHSEVEIKANNLRGREGNYLTVTITFLRDANIIYCAPPTNATSYSLNGNTITIIREQKYNQGENVSIGLPDVRFDNPSYGKEGEKGDGNGGYSYYKSDDPLHAQIQTDDFVVSYYYSL